MHEVWAIQNGYWIHNRVLSSSNFSFSPTQVHKLKHGPHTLKATGCLCSRLVPTLPLRSSETDSNMTQIFSIHSRSRYTIYTINRIKTLAVGFGRFMHHDVPVIWSAPHPGSVANCINAVLWSSAAGITGRHVTYAVRRKKIVTSKSDLLSSDHLSNEHLCRSQHP